MWPKRSDTAISVVAVFWTIRRKLQSREHFRIRLK